MRQETINIYTLDELSEEAQEKVIEAHDNIIYIDSDWYQPTIDYYVDELNKIGFENAEIHFSGFCSQGDGACFNADINFEKFLSEKHMLLKPYINECQFSIVIINTQYVHENTRSVSLDYNIEEISDEMFRNIYRLQDEIEAIRLEWCKKIYAALEKEHEFLRSEEYIREYIKGNEIEFKENGEIY